jgi:tetratricopeptide (TPR) repeat protein
MESREFQGAAEKDEGSSMGEITFDKIMEFDEQKNREVFDELFAFCSINRIVPFIGSGLSAFAAFPVWRDFLSDESEKITGRDRIPTIRIVDTLETANYLEDELTHPVFYEDIRVTYGGDFDENHWDKLLAETENQAVSAIPKLFKGPIITTNFDKILEQVHQKQAATFKSVAFPGNTETLKEAVNKYARVLFKIHGCVSDINNIVFTGRSYKHAYKEGSPLRTTLAELFMDFRFLFLGCSLKEDKTIDWLWNEHIGKIKDSGNGMYHFAIYPCKSGEQDDERKRLEEIKVHPILFKAETKDDYDSVRIILEALMILNELIDLENAPADDESLLENKSLKNNEVLLEKCEKIFGEDSPVTANMYYKIGQYWLYKDELSAAYEYYMKALPTFVNMVGTEDVRTADLYYGIGQYWLSGVFPDSALECFMKALPTYESVLGVKHTTTSAIYCFIADAYALENEYEKAQEYLEKYNVSSGAYSNFAKQLHDVFLNKDIQNAHDVSNLKEKSSSQLHQKLKEQQKKTSSPSFSVIDYIDSEQEQDRHPIVHFDRYEWLVLDVCDDKALLLSKYIVKKMPFDTNSVGAWSECDLHDYLNSEFLENFTKEYRQYIRQTPIMTPKDTLLVSPEDTSLASGGDESNDYVFLLSIAEVLKYFTCDGSYTDERFRGIESRRMDELRNIAGGRVYQSNELIAETFDSRKQWWWLRSPGNRDDSAVADAGANAVRVMESGEVRIGGFDVRVSTGGVRPAMWVSLKSNNDNIRSYRCSACNKVAHGNGNHNAPYGWGKIAIGDLAFELSEMSINQSNEVSGYFCKDCYQHYATENHSQCHTKKVCNNRVEEIDMLRLRLQALNSLSEQSRDALNDTSLILGLKARHEIEDELSDYERGIAEIRKQLHKLEAD